jgi:hypothetical protein
LPCGQRRDYLVGTQDQLFYKRPSLKMD